MSDAPLMLSVSGLRGLIGQSLTPQVAARYAGVVGNWFQSTRGPTPHIIVGRDSRPSGSMIEAAVVAGLSSVGCRVTRVGIVTTPGVGVMVEHLQADGGIVITASHNPIQWNGVKTLRHDSVAPAADEAAAIVTAYRHDAPPQYASVEQLQPIENNNTAHDVHVQRVLDAIGDVEPIRQRQLKVVLDSVHGAGGAETKLLLDALGVDLIHLYAEPTGQFPHNPEPTRENLTQLCAVVREHNADVGFAQDPDADRLAMVDEQGRYIGEEYTLALAAMHVLGQEATEGKASDTLCVAANLSTSRMLDDVAARFNATVLRTPVGEANVAEAMRRDSAVIGGEGNGGVIWPKVTYVRDSLVGIALTLQMLGTGDRKLSDHVADIPTYAIVKDKVAIREGMTDGLTDLLRRQFPDANVDEQDGVRLDWSDRWVHVRPSNTEPILRIIAEAPSEDDATALVKQIRSALNLN